jgi:hypothetical protein
VTDRELIAKKLALVETCVQQLRQLARPAAITTDVREERFVEHRLDDRLGFVAAIRARLG